MYVVGFVSLLIVCSGLALGIGWLEVKTIKLKESRKQERDAYRQILLAISDAVMIVNPQGQIELLNGRAEKLTGYKQEEAKGRHYRGIYQLQHVKPDPLEAVLKGRSMNRNHGFLVARSGREIPVDEEMIPFRGLSGEVQGAICVFRPKVGRGAKHVEPTQGSTLDALTGLYNRAFFKEELHRLDRPENLPLSVIMGDLNGLKLTNDIFGHAKGDELLIAVSEAFRDVCRPEDRIFRWGGDEFIVLLPRTGKEDVALVRDRLEETLKGRTINMIPINLPLGCATKVEEKQDFQAVCQQAEEKMYWVKTTNRTCFEREALNAITQELYARSAEEREHAQRVSRLAEEFGRHLGLSSDELRSLRLCGLLHDIGKIVLEPGLLLQAYPLEPESEREMKRHPLVGFRLLNLLEETADLAVAVLAHHEWWDGSGYPRGLKGEEIPYFARILAVVETYDRVQERNVDRALDLIREAAGSKFDPALSAAFLTMMEHSA